MQSISVFYFQFFLLSILKHAHVRSDKNKYSNIVLGSPLYKNIYFVGFWVIFTHRCMLKYVGLDLCTYMYLMIEWPISEICGIVHCDCGIKVLPVFI